MKYFNKLFFKSISVQLISTLYIICYIPRVKSTCNQSCPAGKPDMLNVHIIAHSHDDVGWLKTVSQYYYGSESNIQNAGVGYILDSVVQSLLQDPTKRFIYVETTFFWMWWLNQREKTREDVRYLVNSGRLQIAGGALSMNDEAVVHYQSTIDQFTWGFRLLNESIGECGYPQIAWQIDPFGHSREMASMLAQMGFEGMFLGRIDEEQRDKRRTEKDLEFIWKASPNLGPSSNIFTSILYDLYVPPPGFCFDVWCFAMPIIDDRDDPDFNANRFVQGFIDHCKRVEKSYSTNHILITMGGDFHYQAAHFWFDNLDRLIRGVNNRQGKTKINVFYSTPACYLKAVKNVYRKWNTWEDDFFPYLTDGNSYWTGYYTSRPTQKYLERLGNNILQVGKQLAVLSQMEEQDTNLLNKLRFEMGIMQHHDAITGTEKQHVADDYARRMTIGIKSAITSIAMSMQKLMTKEGTACGYPKLDLEPCLLLNISQCDISENTDKFTVTVYNPLSRNVRHFVRLPVKESYYYVLDKHGHNIPAQIVPIPREVIRIPGRQSSAEYELVFQSCNLPPLGQRTYFIYRDKSLHKIIPSVDTFIKNKNVRVDLGEDNLLKQISMNGETMSLEQNFHFYSSARFPSSGAYLFRPSSNESKVLQTKAEISVYKGAVVEEIHQTFSDWISQIIRIYNDGNHVEMEWLVGPIPYGIQNNEEREIVSKFVTDLKTNGHFYTDANGRELLKRKRNKQLDWMKAVRDPVAANYYPVTAMIAIRDEDSGNEVAVLTDRAQGGSSIKDGEVELMVHRRLMYDDGKGVEEALSEMAFKFPLVVRGRHYVVAGSPKSEPSISAQKRELALRKLLPPMILLSRGSGMNFETFNERFHSEYSGLSDALPMNVHVLTLEPWAKNIILLRLEHILEETDSPMLSQPVTVDLSKLFNTLTIVSIQERTLAGNREKSSNDQLCWRTGENRFDETEEIVQLNRTTRDAGQSDQWTSEENDIYYEQDGYSDSSWGKYELYPMEIRTFLVEVKCESC